MQVQAALAQQASAFVDQLPTLTLPEPRTERALPVETAPPSVGRLGLDEGWAEDELVTTHYRPATERPAPRHEARPKPSPTPAMRPVRRPRASPVDGPGGADAAWELLELDDPPPPLDRTMLTPRAATPLSFASAAPPSAAPAGWHGPARTGKTLVVHVHDFVQAYAPTLEPALDLPEPAASPTAPPVSVPRLSDELQAALDRLRRRDDGELEEPTTRRGPRRSRRAASPTEVHSATPLDDVPAAAPPRGASSKRTDPEHGDGS
jgi:hypothetical protein